MTALSAFGLISFCGVMPSMFTSNSVMRSFTRRSVRARPTRHWLASNSPTVRTRRLTEMIDVIERAFAAAQADEILHRRDEVFLGHDALVEDRR